MANHRTFLGVYTLQFKKKFKKNTDIVSTNDFLSEAYKDIDNKFDKGFIEDIIRLFDKETFKNKKNTQGGVLEEFDFSKENRTLDIMINGGNTGIKQYIISEDKEQKEVSPKDTVGLKFFARIWFPANSNSSYVFIQKYGNLSIKNLFDDMLKIVFDRRGFSILNNKLKATTTKKRLKDFLNNAIVSEITIISKKSSFDTTSIHANKATIKFSGITSKKSYVNDEELDSFLLEHGLSLDSENYTTSSTYTRTTDGFAEKRTANLDVTEDTINIIPNVIIPRNCINADNSPNFKAMQSFVSNEIEIIKKEAKKS